MLYHVNRSILILFDRWTDRSSTVHWEDKLSYLFDHLPITCTYSKNSLDTYVVILYSFLCYSTAAYFCFIKQVNTVRCLIENQALDRHLATISCQTFGQGAREAVEIAAGTVLPPSR